jgi:hypothetical protein
MLGRNRGHEVVWCEIGLGHHGKVRTIKDQIKATQDRQKQHGDVRRRPLEFSLGDQVFWKVALWKNMLRFGLKGKLGPCFIRQFKILQRIRQVTYKVNMPCTISQGARCVPCLFAMKGRCESHSSPTLSSGISQGRLNAQSEAHKNSRMGSERTTK